MKQLLEDERLQQVLSPRSSSRDWEPDLERLLAGDEALTRKSAGEAGIRAVQRVLVFLGYSTSWTGAFTIDGDFGRGTNRGVAQFQFEHGLNPAIKRSQLCYPCAWNTARHEIKAIPTARLDRPTLEAMAEAVLSAGERGELPLGRFEDALEHLNALDERRLLDCAQIQKAYGARARAACDRIAEERGVAMRPEWVLSIIRQESAGVVRPRFEQHKLSKFARDQPRADLAELRLRSMSIGLGQIMGFNYEKVGVESARSLITAGLDDQVLFVARFLAPRKAEVAKLAPKEADFHAVACHYNGPKYADHHYHESLERWFREFRGLAQ